MKLLSSPRFDLDEFLERGFTVTSLRETALADKLLSTLRTEPFVAPEDIFGGDIYSGSVTEPSFNVKLKKALAWDWEGKKHPLIWEKGMNGKDDPNLFTSYPEVFQHFWNELVDTELHWFTSTYGRFSRFGMLAHKYEVGQGLGWHHDLSDSTWLNCILYLGVNGDYDVEDGGYLSIGRCRLDSEGIPIIPSEKVCIRLERVVRPLHGTIVFLDNRRANLLHRVPILKKEHERYTLSCQLGFIENLMAKKFKNE